MSEMLPVRLPTVYWRGFRYRPRFRFIRGWKRVWRATDEFPEGTVYRLCLGYLMFTVMIDRRPSWQSTAG